ncbi:Protein transport protein BOS1 [Cyberlindnera fabianii]|nr:Protein transport protein BOS1 [Cyberlindnera fabianii]
MASFESNLSTSPLSIQGSIAASLTQLGRTIDDYEAFSKNETDEVKLEKANNRIRNFRTEISELRKKFQELKSKRDELTQEANRSELMRRHTSTQQNTASDNPFSSSGSTNGSGMSQAEGMYKEHQSLSRGNAMLDDILEMGHASFDQLVESNQILKDMQVKLTGTLGTLGVSQETIRTITKVAKTDKFIFYSGAFTLFFLIYLFWRWMK